MTAVVDLLSCNLQEGVLSDNCPPYYDEIHFLLCRFHSRRIDQSLPLLYTG